MTLVGKLASGSAAPARGETTEELWRLGESLVVEQVLTGHLDQPVDFCDDFDEWVLVLSGAAELTVEGEVVRLNSGDWVLLERMTPHRLIRADPGTTWLAVKATLPD